MGCSVSYNKPILPPPTRRDTLIPQRPPLHPRNGSVVADITDLTHEHFTQTQKELLRETWEILSENQYDHGVAIFMRIFVTKPGTKQLFPFRDLEGEELLRNPLFCSHAKRFMHAIETTIHHLDALDLILAPVLHRLGEKHVRIPGFKIEYLGVFIGSMMDVFSDELGRGFTQDIRAAWLHLGEFIAEKMNEGFQRELVRRSIEMDLPRKHTKNGKKSLKMENSVRLSPVGNSEYSSLMENSEMSVRENSDDSLQGDDSRMSPVDMSRFTRMENSTHFENSVTSADMEKNLFSPQVENSLSPNQMDNSREVSPRISRVGNSKSLMENSESLVGNLKNPVENSESLVGNFKSPVENSESLVQNGVIPEPGNNRISVTYASLSTIDEATLAAN